MADISFDDLIPAAPGPQSAAPTPGAAPLSFDDLVPAPSNGVGTYAAESGKAFIEGGKNLGASALKGYGAGAAGFNKKIVSVLDRIDAGEGVETLPDIEDTMGYRHMSPEQRAQTRAQMEPAAAKPITENPLYRAGTAVEDFGKDALAPAPGWENSWTRDISSGFGSMLAGMGLSLVPGIGAEMAGAVFLGSGMGEAVDRAKKAGATDDEAIKAARLGAIAGATDVVDALIPMLGSTGKALGFIRRVGMRTVYGALAEGGQEGLQQVIQNAIAKGIYKPDQDLMEDVPRNMAVGAIVGGATSGGISATQGRGQQEARLRSGNTATDALPEAPVNPEADKALSELDAILADNAPEVQPQPSAHAVAAEPDLFNQPERAPSAEAEPVSPIEEALQGAPVTAKPEWSPTDPETFDMGPDDYFPPERRDGDFAAGDTTVPEPEISAPSNEDEKINTAAESGGIPNGDIVYVPPGLLKIDAKRFQFKGGADEHGVTGALKGVAKWDDRLANPILAWESNDGDVYVANGHQRTDLAKRAEVGGQEDVKIPARILREADGFTPDFMRALGAYQNIAEGTGTAVDAAKVLRANQKDLGLPELPPRSQLVQDAKALAALGNDAFGMVANGLVPEAYAAQVGRILKDPAEQLAAMDALAKSAPANVDQARIMVEDIRESGFLKGAQTGLFGEEEFARSLVAERARILDTAIKNLRKLGSTFKTAVEQEGTLAEAGNKLEREANVKARTENERLAETLRTDGTRKGPISDALSDAARELAAGKRIGTVVPLFLGKVRSLAGGKPQGVQHGAAADRAGPAREEGQRAVATAGRAEQRPVAAATASEKEAPQPSLLDAAPSPPRKGVIEDFGEKIGGARKDLAETTGPRASVKKPEDTRPTWAKRFTVREIEVKSSSDGETGKRWEIHDERTDKPLMDPNARWKPRTFATKEEAERALPLAAVAQKHRVVSGADNTFRIIRDVTDRKRVTIKDGFKDRDEAIRYLHDHAVEILETKTGFGEEILAAPDTVKREGPERRKGDATEKDFSNTFGFRGVEFGNWNNQIERQEVMNHAYDGLLDLAELLNIPPKALSLDGELAIAFGARGHGLSGARAHYERDYGVINLTKMSGAGSLAHEWMHALDAYLARQDTKASSKKIKNERGDDVYDAGGTGTDYISHGPSYKSQLRADLKTALKDVADTINTKAETYVEDTQQTEKWLNNARKRLADAVTDIRGDLAKKREYGTRHVAPANVEQLARFDALAEKLKNGDDIATSYKVASGKQGARITAKGRYTNDTIDAISAIYKEVRGRAGFSEGHGPVDRIVAAVNDFKKRLDLMDQAAKQSEKTRRIPTQYARDAYNLDQGRSSDYWGTPHELLARAMSAYVEDKVAERGGRSDFLSYGSDNAFYRIFNARPFPEGKERVAINAAFDRLFTTIKTREGKLGEDTALYSISKPDRPMSRAELTKMVKDQFPKGWSFNMSGSGDRIWLKAPGSKSLSSGMPNSLHEVEAVLSGIQRIERFERRASGKPTTETVELAKGERREQYVIPGAERVTQAEQAQRLADEALRAKKPQKAADFGLFGDDKDQGSLFDARRDLTSQAQDKRPQLERQLTAIIRRIAGDNVKVAFPDTIQLPRSAAKGWGSSAAGRQTAAGSYIPAERLIKVALADPLYQHRNNTAVHESFHAVEHLLLNDREMALLKKAEPQLRNIAQGFAELSGKQATELADYEVRAIAFEAYAHARSESQPITNFPAAVRAIFDRLRILFDRIRNALHGMGFKASSDVFSDVYEGRLAGREAKERPIGEAAAFDIKGPGKVDPVALSRFIRGEITAAELAADQPKWAKVAAYLAKNFTEAQRAKMGAALDQVMTGDAEALETLSAPERAVVEKLLGETGGKPPAPPKAPPATAGGGKGARQRILDRIVPSDKNKPRLPTFNDVYTLAKDDLNPIRVLRNELTEGKDIPIERDPYRLARLTRGAFGKAEQMIETGTFKFDDLSDSGKGLKPILDPVKNDLDGFRAYMAARRAMELSGRGIKTGIDPKDAATVVRDGADKYAKPFTELVAYQRRVLDYLRDSGLVSPDAYAAMVEANKDYVPFFRMMEGELSNNGGAGGRSLRVKDPIKGIKGSTREIIDPLESIIKNTYLYVALAEKNRALTALDDLAASSPKGEQFVAKPKEAPAPVSEDPSNPESLSIFKPEAFRPSKDNIAFYRNGKREVRQVQPDVAEAVNAMDRESFGLLLRFLATPARLLRAGATLAPEFIARNPIRDQFSALVFSEHGYIPVYDFVRGLGGIFKNDATYQAWLKAGGANSAMVSLDRHYIEQNVMQLAQDPTFGQRVKNVITKPVDLLRALSELAENATRLGEFKRAVGKGKSPMEAAFASREVTLDFQRIGNQMRAVNAIIPFFNASIEGTDREIRGFGKRPFASALKVGAAITLPSVLLWFAHHDDDRYKEIPQWQKDLFWLIFTDKWEAISEDDAKQIPAAYKRLRNNQWEQNNGTIWRIPKPFALGLLFGSVPERALDAFYDKHPNAFNHLGKSLQGALLPNMVPAFMAPMVEQFSNRSLFTERPIVPKYLEDVLPKYQYAPYTSETAKLLGKAVAKIGGDQTTFASPLVIDNYIRAWTGGLGQYAVALSDKALTATGLVPSKVNPTLTPADMPVIRAFAVRHPSAGAQSIQDFYETYDERKKALGTVKYLTKLGEPEAAGAEAESHNIETAERIHKALGQQMKFARDVWFNRTMTPDDKRKLIDTTYLQAIDLARVGNDIFRATAQSKKDMKDRAGRLETAP